MPPAGGGAAVGGALLPMSCPPRPRGLARLRGRRKGRGTCRRRCSAFLEMLAAFISPPPPREPAHFAAIKKLAIFFEDVSYSNAGLGCV